MRRVLSWFRDRGGINWPGVLLAALAVALLAGLVFFASTSSVAFGPFNPAWDGTSDFREQVADDPDTALLTARNTERYDTVDANGTVAFVVAPDQAYGPDDVDRVRGFLERGGTLVVMENFEPPGNELLQDIGANASVDGRLVRDEQRHDEAPTMPVATNVTEHRLTDGVDQLTLNYASVVEPDGATVLVRTSEFAYLTEDEGVELDDDTELVAAPVATVEPAGNGTVVAVSDPSILINVMLQRPDNDAFLQGLSGGADRVLADFSHAAGFPPVTRAVLFFRDSALSQVLLGGLGIAVVGLLAERRGRAVTARLPIPAVRRRPGGERSPPTMTAEEREAYLRRRHPDWDDERIRRLITAFNRGDTIRESNEDQ